MLEEVVSFPDQLGDTIRIRVVGELAAKPTHEERVRGQAAARELRLGVEQNRASVLAAAQQLGLVLHDREPTIAPSELDALHLRGHLEALVERLERDFELGRLLVIEGATPLLSAVPERELGERERLPLPELPPARDKPLLDPQLTFFEFCLLDEVGQGIGGVDVEFKAGALTETIPTNPAGIALLEDVKSFSARAAVVSSEALAEIVGPRWDTPRRGRLPSGVNTKTLAFTGQAINALALKPAVINTLVITPPLGKLFVELVDKTGRTKHVAQKYAITGPENFDGETDEDGRLLHEDVFVGNYELTLSLEIDTANEETVTDTHSTPLVVLEASHPLPQVRMLGVTPYVAMARMRGMLFDTNKCFLLPTAMDAMRRIRQIYEEQSPCELLIVGHTDTTAEPDLNDKLSVERAVAMQAYIEDDVDLWLKNYDLSGKKKWGSREDRLMITAMPDFRTRAENEDLIKWFQRTRELEVDGEAGKQTRTQLITEYMALDGVKLKDEPDFEINIQTHGAGENFPLEGTGFELDQNAADEKEDAFDRRIELFFFDPEFKILPAPGAPDGKEYLEWRRRAAENDDFPVEGIGKKAIVIEVHDALFRTNSSVVLPEGEDPSADEHQSLTSLSLFATTLRFNEAFPGRKLLIAGHTDTTAEVAFNQTLSEERAEAVLCMLIGDAACRLRFASLAHARHKVSDYKQILSWCAAAFPELFSCDPGSIDDQEFTGIEPVRQFQNDFNASKATIGSNAADLDPDGDIGELTWAAMFDVYQMGIREELGGEASRVDELRKKLAFVDDDNKFLGFSEHHPIEAANKNNFRSQTNRRAEIIYFETGEEPDIPLAKQEPDISEIYLPAVYDRVILDVESGPGVPQTLTLTVFDEDRQRMPDVQFRVKIGEQVQKGRTTPADDPEGAGRIIVLDVFIYGPIEVMWGENDLIGNVAFEDPIGVGAFDEPDLDRALSYEYVEVISLDTVGGRSRITEQRLHNLGYEDTQQLTAKITQFQQNYRLPPAPLPDPTTEAEIDRVHKDGVEMPPPPDDRNDDDFEGVEENSFNDCPVLSLLPGVAIRPALFVGEDFGGNENLVFQVEVPNNERVIALEINGQPVDSDANFFDDGQKVFFASVKSSDAEVGGSITLERTGVLEFNLSKATNVELMMLSVLEQSKNARDFVRAATDRAIASGKASPEGFTSELLKTLDLVRLEILDGIQEQLSTEADFATFQERAGDLPALNTEEL